jgi:hypothetical protein
VSTLFSPDEFAGLVGVSRQQVDDWRSDGLLDPAAGGSLDELDLAEHRRALKILRDERRS